MVVVPHLLSQVLTESASNLQVLVKDWLRSTLQRQTSNPRSALKPSAYRKQIRKNSGALPHPRTHRAMPPSFAAASTPPPILALPSQRPALSDPTTSLRRSCPGALRALGRSPRSSAPGVPGGTRPRRRRSLAVFEARRRPSG
jgi:hypothetical protein